MDKFEYRTMIYDPKGFAGGKVDGEALQDALNKFGSRGWELVSCVSSNSGYGHTRSLVCIFKRKIQ